MNKYVINFSCFLFIVLLCACSGSDSQPKHANVKNWMSETGRVKVLSTISMIDDLVKQVGGEHINSLTLIQGELDPHSYQLVKGDDEKLASADLIFCNGLGLEHGPSLQRYLDKNPKATALGNLIKAEDTSLVLYEGGQPDPHIWMDIALWSKTIPYIVKALAQQDPQHAEEYRRNGDLLIANMMDVHGQVRAKIQTIPPEKRYLVTSHDAFCYFARAYLAESHEAKGDEWRKRVEAPEGLAPESQLSIADIQFIINYMHARNIQVLFPESNVSKDSIRKIVQSGNEKGLQLIIATTPLYGDAMGKPGSDGDTYLKMISHNAKTIAQYLLGEEAAEGY